MIRKLLLLVFLPVFIAFGQTNEDCQDCHNDHELTTVNEFDEEISLFVSDSVFAASIHSDLECLDCHQVPEAHLEDGGEVDPADCGSCHDEALAEYKISVHGTSKLAGKVTAATCADCHGKHNILSADDEKSQIFAKNLPQTCGSCHSKPEIMVLFGRRSLDYVESYKHSVHGELLETDPDTYVATCTICHGSHKILPAINPESNLHVLNIPATCGECHEEAQVDYENSIHWQALNRGHYESPVCTDCHGEHNIKHPDDPEAPTSPLHQSTELCATCHASATMMENFGLDHRRLESYLKSYHGLAILKGSPEAAHCTSCHETHSIRSSVDSESSVNKVNLVKTCSECHKNVTESFAAIDVHPVDQATRNPVAYIFRNIYWWMILLVIGGMAVHNIIILIHHIREKRKSDKAQIRYRRFQPFEVYQHMLMFLSFTTLAWSGFALKFPDAGWVQLLVNIGMTELIRSWIHRGAAIVMMTISFIQLFYFLFSPKGRKDFIALIPSIQDMRDVLLNMRYHLGLTKEHAKFSRYDYAEKAEYLALIWGVIVMGATGFILWFPEFFIRYLPSWTFETAEVIHYYEAWLATLAIVVWHWFFVIYHPQRYPMSTTWMDGMITEEDLKHHHGNEYDALKGQGKPSLH